MMFGKGGQVKSDSDPFVGVSSQDERRSLQLDKWVQGLPLHNSVDDICCPDFSCCGVPMVEEETRRQYADAYKKKDACKANTMLQFFTERAIQHDRTIREARKHKQPN